MKKLRNECTIELIDINNFINKALSFGSTFSHCTYFNNNNLDYLYGPFPHMLMIGCNKEIKRTSSDPFEDLKKEHEVEPDWYTGYFGYDLKNIIEELESKNTDRTGFDDFVLYRPEHIIIFNITSVKILSFGDPELLFKMITTFEEKVTQDDKAKNRVWQSAVTFEEYIEKVHAIKEHIMNGDVYELNFCIEFFADEIQIDPVKTFLKLNKLSPMPFSVFGKYNHHYLLCASPERFLKKQGNKLISQPIKGTAKRGNHKVEDEEIKGDLQTNEKEQAENLMIVDLVRNDLAKSSKAGSVKVKELFGVYTFHQMHQMISTVTSELQEEINFTDAIKNAFPMGSMTGAPKVKVMELVEHYENSKRGIYSGAAGYITPDGDFDLNVIIRSLFYNDETKTLSFQVGSAITYDSIPEKEYQECLLKADAMIKIL